MLRRIPRYCRHKGTGQAYVTIDGRERYLGPYGSPESREEYDGWIVQWRRDNDVAGKYTLTVGQLCLMFTEHADTYYRTPDGTPTGEANNFRDALKPLCTMFRGVAVSEFGPRRLEQVRERMIVNGHVRTAINKHISRIRHVFKWGVSREIVPAEVYGALITLAPLRRGRSAAAEPKPVLPVPSGDIEAIKRHVTAPVWGMVQLQLLTGMRPSEVRGMRCGDIDRSGKVWQYVPRRHKTEHHGRRRLIFIGP